MKDTIQSKKLGRHKDQQIIKPNISPLRIKKKCNVDEGIISINESIFAKDKDVSSIRNSYNYMISDSNNQENVSLHANQQEYSMTQKFSPIKGSAMNIEVGDYELSMAPNTVKNEDHYYR